jgi:AcrR family transcriptional regulator
VTARDSGNSGEIEGGPARADRLPAGRHGLPREFVERNQRERVVTAMADTVAEKGYNATTVGDIIKAAGVSRRTFYEHFADKEACFLAAYEMVADHIFSSMRAAADSFAEWPQRVRAALATMLRFLAAEPELARLVMIAPNVVGGEAAVRHRASLQRFAEVLKEGRPPPSAEHPLPESVEETLVGGIVSLIVREIEAGRGEQLERLLSELVELTLVPYVGAEQAARLAAAR